MRQHIDFIRHIVRSVMRYTCVTQFSFKPFVNPKSFGGGFTVPRVMHCCHGYTGVFFLSCSFCFWSLKSGRNTKRLPRYTDGINQPIKNTHHFFPRAQRDNLKLIISPQSILTILFIYCKKRCKFWDITNWNQLMSNAFVWHDWNYYLIITAVD